MTDIHMAIQAWLSRADQTAARWLVETCRPLVMKILYRRLPTPGMIDDVAQEVFMKAFRALPNLDEHSQFEAWLSAIARNTATKACRVWNQRFIFNASDLGFDLIDGAIATQPQRRAPSASSLARLLASLGEKDQRIFWLYHVEGLPAQAVAQKLGLSPGNVRVRACRTQRALRAKAAKLHRQEDW